MRKEKWVESERRSNVQKEAGEKEEESEKERLCGNERRERGGLPEVNR